MNEAATTKRYAAMTVEELREVLAILCDDSRWEAWALARAAGKRAGKL